MSDVRVTRETDRSKLKLQKLMSKLSLVTNIVSDVKLLFFSCRGCHLRNVRSNKPSHIRKVCFFNPSFMFTQISSRSAVEVFVEVYWRPMEHQNAAFIGGELQLGFPGHFLNQNHSPGVSAKVGGLSDWLVPCDQTIACSCGARMYLVFQVYAPLKYARTLYVFACRKPDCNGIKAFSMVSTNYVEPAIVETKTTEPSNNKPSEDWGAETEAEALPQSGTAVKAPTNDDDDLEALLLARAAKASQKSAVHTQQKSGKGKGTGKAAVVVHTKETLESKAVAAEKPKPATSVIEGKKEDCLLPWEVVWDDAKNCGQTIDLSKEERLLRLYRETEGQLEVPEEDENETFAEEAYEAEEGPNTDNSHKRKREKNIEFSPGDRAWRKFTKAIAQCPKQCARYCFGGFPLRMSDEHQLPSPEELACPNCQTPRVFELQLLPTLCSELEQELEWGTVDVYVCPASCQPDSLVQEFAIRYPAV